jgi:4,5:9,10-diseco-3-hydroxy-5,9,17-trioxoandrosta-1(10),2-diene-4-oate hydrolase
MDHIIDESWMRHLPGVSVHDWNSEVRTRYLQAGSGPPLLLLHGLLGYSFSWRYNLLPLSRFAAVYAPDLPGTGYSERVLDLNTDLTVRAEHMLRFMDVIHMEHANILGTSLGGALATMLTLLCEKRNPGRVRSLILVDPVNPWSRHGKLVTRIGATTPGTLALRCTFPAIKMMQRVFLARMYGDPKRISPGTMEGYTAPLDHPQTLNYAISVIRSWHGNLQKLKTAYDELGEIRTLLIWGDRDRAVIAKSAYELQKRLPNSELVVLKGIGHLPYEEAPDEFNETVRRFLTS